MSKEQIDINFTFFTISLNLINEVILLLIVSLVMYYLYFILFGIIFENKIEFVKTLEYFYGSNLLISFKDVNFRKKFLYATPIWLPFILNCIFNNSYSAIVLVIMILILLYIFLNLITKKVLLIAYISLPLSIFIWGVFLFQLFKKSGLVDCSEVLNLFVIIYSVISLTIIFIYILICLITIDYRIADIAKKLILMQDIFAINFCDREYKSKVILKLSNRTNANKFLRASARGKVILKRNTENLYISFMWFLTLVFGIILIFISKEFWFEFFIMMLIFLTLRYFMRSWEIVKAFFNDAISQKNKKSNLSEKDRIILILKSLVEIAITAFTLRVIYHFLMIDFSSVSLEFRNIILLLLESISIQIFNVSFSTQNGLFYGVIHIIQTIISSCLLLLSLSLYSGRAEETSDFEIRYNTILDEYEIYRYHGEEVLKSDLLFKVKDFLDFEKLISRGQINKIEYRQLVEEFNNLQEWRKQNDELQKALGCDF